MKKMITLLLAIVSLLPILSAQTDLKVDKTYGTEGQLEKISDPDLDHYFTHFHHFKNSKELMGIGSYYDFNTDKEGWVFVKYNKDGKLDDTFAEKGVLVIPYEDSPYFVAIRVREAADKSLLVLIGNSSAFNADSTAIIMITPQGKLSTTFGDKGFLASKNNIIADFDIQTDATILTLTNVVDTVTQAISGAFERYSSLGVLDKNFGKNGAVEFQKGFEAYGRMERLNQGYICVGASIDFATFNFIPCISKVSAAGVLDKTFGLLGIAKVAALPTDEFMTPSEVKILADGSYIVYGLSINDKTDSVSIAFTKINKNGSPDTNFGKKGYLFIENFGNENNLFAGVEELAGGKLLTLSTVGGLDLGNLAISAQLFSAKGKAEKQFGDQGEIRINVEDQMLTLGGTEIQPDGKILLAGAQFNETDEVFETLVTRLELVYGVGTDEKVLVNAASVFPNPMQERATLSYDLLENTVVSVQLFDLQGKMVQQVLAPQTRSAGKQTETLNFDAALPAGIYALQIQTEKGILVIKVSKN